MTASKHMIGGTHYTDMPIQPWDVIDTWPLEQRIGFYRGTALAYVMRAGSKGDAAEDIAKSVHTLQKLAEVMESEGMGFSIAPEPPHSAKKGNSATDGPEHAKHAEKAS